MEELKKFLGQMDGPHRRSAIVRISDCCFVSKRTIKRWVESESKIRDTYKRAINKEFNCKVFEI